MLEREGEHIDAVTVSTPDHTHAAAAMMALRMGKHVYCQKPLTRTIGEARALERAAREAGVATQMGNQGHSWEGTRQIREWVEAGWIGAVHEVHYWTNRPIWPQAVERPLELYHVPRGLNWDVWWGPAPERPYHPAYAPFNWRGWWDFGTGALGDMACHAMDPAFWALELGYPTRITVESTALFEETAPAASPIVYEFSARGGRAPVTVVWQDQEWIAACKSGGKAGSDFALHAGPLTEMVLLGNLAVRTAKVLEIDPGTGRVTNTAIPEEYLVPTYRAGWSL